MAYEQFIPPPMPADVQRSLPVSTDPPEAGPVFRSIFRILTLFFGSWAKTLCTASVMLLATGKYPPLYIISNALICALAYRIAYFQASREWADPLSQESVDRDEVIGQAWMWLVGMWIFSNLAYLVEGPNALHNFGHLNDPLDVSHAKTALQTALMGGVGVVLFLLAVGVLMVAYTLILSPFPKGPSNTPQTIEMLTLSDADELRSSTEGLTQGQYSAIGGVKARIGQALHRFYLAATSSGKSLLLAMQLKSELIGEDGGLRARAIIFDPKGELLSRLASFVPEGCLHIMGPMDERAHGWAISKDLVTEQHAEQLASDLKPKGNSDFWLDSFAALLKAICFSLIKTEGGWTFHRLIDVSSNPALAQEVLGRTHLGRVCRDTILPEGPEATRNIFTTLHTHLSKMSLAAAMDATTAREPISLSEWQDPSNPHSVIVVVTDPKSPDVFAPYIRTLFNFVLQSINGREENDNACETHVVIDEMHLLGRIDMLPIASVFSRSKGGRITLVGHDIRLGQKDYPGEFGAIVGSADTVLIGGLNDPDTAEWAQKRFGKCRRPELSKTRNGDGSESTTVRMEEKPIIDASVALQRGKPRPEEGIPVTCWSKNLRAVWDEVISPEIVQALLPPQDPSVKGVVFRKDNRAERLRDQPPESGLTASRDSSDFMEP